MREFIDRVKIKIKAGDGGNGITSFIHYKGVVNGGPDGGDGGKGGDIIFRATRHKTNLADFYYKKSYVAENGGNGEPKNCSGKGGKDTVLEVPLGTVIKDYESGEIVADMFYEGDSIVVLKGGDGGKGNARFVTSRRHAPHFSQLGEKVEAQNVVLELKTIADVGLVGFPNVGKSTLLSVITNAKPKIANYHFTTLSPNLGIANCYDENFVVADIPGLIEGAADGAGLGIEFLRHIERTRLIVHVVDMSGIEGRDAFEDYEKINKELENYSEKLASTKQIVVANKMDCADAEENLKEFVKKAKGVEIVKISAINRENLNELLKKIKTELDKLPKPEPLVFEPFVYEKPETLSYEIVKNDDGTYEIVGSLIDVLARNVVIDDEHSFAYMQKVMKDRKVFEKLRKMGVSEGTTILVGGVEFEYKE